MDGTMTKLKEKLDATPARGGGSFGRRLDRVDGTIVGVPHYSVIEG